jgi:hypothetical protein
MVEHQSILALTEAEGAVEHLLLAELGRGHLEHRAVTAATELHLQFPVRL